MTGEHYQNEKIKALRKAAGLQQDQLALLVDAHPVTIAKIEGGGVCSFDLIERIASALQVDWRELMRLDPATQQNKSKKLALGVDSVSV